MTSNNNACRHVDRRGIASLVPMMVVSIVFSTALHSTIPAAHALVVPSATPHHRPLWRKDLPSPSTSELRADRTVLHYIDERTGTEPVFHDIWTLREQAKTIKKHDRQAYFDFVNNVEPTAPNLASPPHPTAVPCAMSRETLRSPSSLLSSLPSSVASLWTQARRVAEDDRRVYFDFVRNQSLSDNLATESGLSTGLIAKRKNSVRIDKWW